MKYSVSASVFLFLTLGAHIAPALAGSCISKLRDGGDGGNKALGKQWAKCKTRPPQWACEHHSVTFPTVDCLKEDMRTCGVIGTGPSVFYSFGASTVQAREKCRDQLDPRGVMFNDALDGDYFIEVLARPDFDLKEDNRKMIFRDRYSQALAELAKDEVFMVVLNYNGDYGGQGIYQNQRVNEDPNVWTRVELPTLQRNREVKKVSSFSINDGNKYSVDWEPGNGQVLPLHDTRQTPVPASQPDIKRDTQSNQCTSDETEDEECEE